MENNDVARKAEERRRKVIANAEARLRKITEMAKLQNNTTHNFEKPSADGFVDFEVDSFVNEPSKSANSTTSNGSAKFPGSSKQSHSSQGSDETIRNGFPLNSRSERSPLESGSSEELARLFASGGFGSRNFMFPDPLTGYPGVQPSPNGLNQMNYQEMNNAMSNLVGGLSQNPAELSNLLNALSGLASAPGPGTQQAPAQEEIHPVLKPVLNIIIFLLLGVATRIFFQFSTLKINVFAPFLCLAVPLAIMSWGRRQTPMTGLLSAVLLFVRNPRTQKLIINWVRLTTLLRGLSRLFAAYFFTFVLTHVAFELSSISTDINEYSSSVN